MPRGSPIRWAFYFPSPIVARAHQLELDINQIFFDKEVWFSISYTLSNYGGWPPDYTDEQDHEKVMEYYEYVVKVKERETQAIEKARQEAWEQRTLGWSG